MGIKKISGSKIYIGPQVTYKSSVTLLDFAGLTPWTEITGWITAGDLGAEQEAITQLLIDQGVTEYAKGALSFPASTQTFVPNKNDPGQIAFAAAIQSCHPFAFRFDWGADCEIQSVVTISNASPAVVTWAGHPLQNGDVVSFTTTGTLPTGLTANTSYYVVGSASGSFSVAAVPGGAAIDTSSAGSGVHTAHAMPGGETEFVYGFAMPGVRSGGDATATRQQTLIIQPIAASVIV